MLAALFIQGGISTLRAPQGHAQAARPVLDAVAPAVDKAVEISPIAHRPDDVLLVKIDAGVKIVAGSMLALGKAPRLASAALAASIIPTTFAGHRFWEEADEQRKREQQIHFVKNVGILGGLLIASADTEGKPSMGWRGRKAAKLAAAAAGEQAAALSGTASDVSGKLGGRVSGSARDASGTVAGLAAGLAGLAPAAGASVAGRTSGAKADLSSRASEISAEWSKRAAKARKKAEKRGAKLQKATEKHAAELQVLAAKRTAELQKATEKRAAELQARAAKRTAELQKAASAKVEKGSDFLGAASRQATLLGHDVAVRASAVGSEVAHQAEGAVQDARRHAHALTR